MSDEKTYLSVEDIDKMIDTRFDEIDAWGGTLRVASLDADSMIDFIEANEGPAKRTAAIRLLIKSLVDKDGNRIGTDKHIAVFKKKDSATIAKVVKRIMLLNGIGQEAEALAAIKNESGVAPTVASPTVLH